jgi:hypothetical protein
LQSSLYAKTSQFDRPLSRSHFKERSGRLHSSFHTVCYHPACRIYLPGRNGQIARMGLSPTGTSILLAAPMGCSDCQSVNCCTLPSIGLRASAISGIHFGSPKFISAPFVIMPWSQTSSGYQYLTLSILTVLPSAYMTASASDTFKNFEAQSLYLRYSLITPSFQPHPACYQTECEIQCRAGG